MNYSIILLVLLSCNKSVEVVETTDIGSRFSLVGDYSSFPRSCCSTMNDASFTIIDTLVCDCGGGDAISVTIPDRSLSNETFRKAVQSTGIMADITTEESRSLIKNAK